MKRVLVTGGLGYIGSHTCIELLKRDFKITILDSLVNSKSDTFQKIKDVLDSEKNSFSSNIELKVGDIRDNKFIDRLFSEKKNENKQFNSVIHFCGLKSVKESINESIDYWDNNVLGTINLIKAMKKYQCFELVFSSSATVYGNPVALPIKENALVKPLNPYGQTKAAVENLLHDLRNQFPNKFKIAILRYFNPVGAHDSGLIGEQPNGLPNNLFPIVSEVAFGKREKLEIFGKDWPTPDGTCIRDYIHIMDLAEGHYCALDFLMNNSPQIITFNLGTGIGTSVLDLINTFQEVNKINIPYSFSERREGDIPITIADNSYAKSILKWEPKKNVIQMCKDEYKWQNYLSKI